VGQDGPVSSSSTHPRPQLTRPWVDLCGVWSFRYDDADVGRREGWQARPEAYDRTITVPYPPESPASGVGDPGFHPVVWYRRAFECSPAPGRRVLLHFGAVDYRAAVWVNGRLVAEHEGGHTPFHADVTEALHPGGEQEVVVRAEDPPRDLEQPRGKQDWELRPHAIWYSRTTGIWQPVWLEEVPATRIASLRWTPDLDAAQLSLAVRVHREDERPLRLRVRVSLRGEVLADDEYAVAGDEVRRDLALPGAEAQVGLQDVLWAPEHPNLLDTTLELHDRDGVLDTVGSYTAMRSAEAADGRFLLNGQPYFLRLVLAQGFWPETHLAAPDEAALRREVELVRSFGFNGVRLHQKIEDPRFLHWCDRLGLLVWAEMPAAYRFSTRSVTRLTREWLEVLERDHNHPCVIAWVPINESWGVPSLRTSPAQRDLVRALYHLTKSLDQTRPVVGNDGWEQIVSDILTVHDYSRRGETLRERYGDRQAVEDTLRHVQPGYRSVLLPGQTRRDQPVMVTEFGGITLVSSDPASVWSGYGRVRDVEAFVERYRSLVDALLDSPALTGFCYTQLTDALQEQNGLLTERREPKVSPDRIRGINCRTSAAVPADAIGEFDFGDYPAPPGDRIDQDGRSATPGS
jgi:beta-galactosidase/beta-glucuronidase